MYALQRGPSKIVANTRRGPPRAFEVPENTRDQPERLDSGAAMSAPKPYFSHTQNHNGRTRNQSRPNSHENMAPHHRDSASYLEQKWNKTMQEYQKFRAKQLAEGPEFYRQREHNPELENFKKFDLEEYWGKRTMRRLTESS